VGTHFDELSKALARGESRKSALKRFAAGLAGAALAVVRPGQAAADDAFGCDRDCSDLFPRLGGAWRQCVADCLRCRARGHHFFVNVNGSNPICIRNGFPT
jgi:hypothetical protein